MLPRRIRAQVLLLSIIPLGFLLLLLVLSIVLEQKAQEASWWSAHSAAVLNASDRITSTLNDANDGAVDYVTTRTPQALQTYRRASASMPAALRNLEGLVSDNPPQEARAHLLASYILQGSEILRRYVALVQSGNMRAARILESDPHIRTFTANLAHAKADFDLEERLLAIERFNDLRRQMSIFAGVVIGVTIVGILVTLFTTAKFGLRLAERLRRLGENARVLGEGGRPEPIEGNDEVADLDRVYLAMARRLRQEHRVASTLQQALLPQDTPHIPGLEISAAYSPASKGADIGGDWYDAFPLDGDVLALDVGDVSGSGLQAATIMGAVRQAMRTVAREHSDPAEVLGIVNRMVCAEGWLVSAFLATLDVGTRRLHFASAGHPPPLMAVDGGEIQALESDGLLLGVDPSAEFLSAEVSMPENALLVLYTDGLIEAERDMLLGAKRLREIVSDSAVRGSDEPALEIQRRVFENVTPRDDSAILTLRNSRVADAEPAREVWMFDATDSIEARRVRREMIRFIADRIPQSDPTPAELIFGELAGNIAKHSPGSAKFSVEQRNGCVVMQMAAKGVPFKYEFHGVDPLAEEGRGLFIVHTLAKEVAIEREDGSNVVTVVLPV